MIQPPFTAFDFDDRPFVVIWEITRACALACQHCRAEAEPRPHPLQLTSEEGFDLIDQVAGIRPGLFILTGGDPVMRRDLPDLVRHATERGLHVSLSPSATPRLLNSDFHVLRAAGVRRISLSIDGPTRLEHDEFRGVLGTWNWTMRAVEKCREAALPFQVNTTITRGNIDRFDEFTDLMETLKPALWSVFLLVPTGRAGLDQVPEPEEMEAFLHKLQRYSRWACCDVKTTEGPFYRRVLVQNNDGVARLPFNRRAPAGINDGKGFVFISHTGWINPSGFLPVGCGNVRKDRLIDIYREHPTFRSLRDPSQLKGKCGRCQYRRLCGGSRARAYNMAGDFLAADPLCPYQPGEAVASEWQPASSRSCGGDGACDGACGRDSLTALAID